jgi:hypothetical protein
LEETTGRQDRGQGTQELQAAGTQELPTPDHLRGDGIAAGTTTSHYCRNMQGLQRPQNMTWAGQRKKRDLTPGWYLLLGDVLLGVRLPPLGSGAHRRIHDWISMGGFIKGWTMHQTAEKWPRGLFSIQYQSYEGTNQDVPPGAQLGHRLYYLDMDT